MLIFVNYLLWISTNPTPFIFACRLASGVWVLELSDVRELTDDKEDNTSETGATPKEDSISSKSLNKINNNTFFFRYKKSILSV